MAINVSLATHKHLYTDYKKCIQFLHEINHEEYEYPDTVTNFHLYSEVKTDKELMAIKSFFATQNLEKTKLVLWSDYDISDNPRIQRFKNRLDMRVWDAKKKPLVPSSKEEMIYF